MERLHKEFESAFKSYERKRKRFEKKIAAWRNTGEKELFSRGSQLLHEADACLQDIRLGCTQTAEGLESPELLNDKYKQFKKVVAELNQLTQPPWRLITRSIIGSLFLASILRLFIFGLYHVPTGSAEPNILVGDRIIGNKLAYYFGDVKRGDLVIFDNPEFIHDRTHFLKYMWQKHVGVALPLLDIKAGPENWVKRVIALPGDVIEGRIDKGRTVLYLNGEKLEETYVNKYPLIRLRKTTGFFKRRGIPILRQKIKDVNYTYNPAFKFEAQPYYSFSEKEIVRTAMSQDLVLTHPKTPMYVLQHKGKAGLRSVDTFGPITVPKGMYWVMGDSRKNSRDSRYWGLLDGKMIRGRASRVLYSLDSEESFWFYALIKHPLTFWTRYLRWTRFFKPLV